MVLSCYQPSTAPMPRALITSSFFFQKILIIFSSTYFCFDNFINIQRNISVLVSRLSNENKYSTKSLQRHCVYWFKVSHFSAKLEKESQEESTMACLRKQLSIQFILTGDFTIFRNDVLSNLKIISIYTRITGSKNGF